MAEVEYTFPRIKADLALFGFPSVEEFTVAKLAGRFRTRMGKAHPDLPGGNAELAKALAAARDRLRQWEQKGRPIPVEPQPPPKPDGPYAGYADTAATAAARAKARDDQARKEEEGRAAEAKREMDELAAEIVRLKRVRFRNRCRRVAFAPFRASLWWFAHMPANRMPWLVAGLLFVFGMPFLQDSSYGAYLPRFPSVYDWFGNTQVGRVFKNQDGTWISLSPQAYRKPVQRQRCSLMSGNCWYEYE